ncbi:SpoIIE family protein phosphatase [Cellulomonas timonensis]|uniref:SpoIIE family protein phosphatase n=1 Tax=Cellulomonas timonensis TaxID=1689271 RepID=UPI00082DB13D|nr:SpoIIE family protein phosphatase [Cellulomonas timonensis]
MTTTPRAEDSRALPVSASLPAEADEAFERFCRLAQRQLDTPVVLASLISQEGQVIPGAVGLPPDLDATRMLPLALSLCQHVVADAAPLITQDARLDARLSESGAVRELGFVAYAGFPIVDARDQVVGTLCALDVVPREWSEDDRAVLLDLAEACSSELRLRGERERARRAQQQATRSYRQSGLLLLLSDAFQDALTVRDVARTAARVAATGLGTSFTGLAALERDGRSLSYVSMEAFTGDDIERWRRTRITDDRPIAHVARTRKPLFYEDRATLVADFPVVGQMEFMGEARAFLPLVSQHRLIGVLGIGWQQKRAFDDDNRTIKTALAAYTAQALERAQLLEERRDVARTLQDAMLTALPQPDHLAMAAHYLPAGRADRVGGDWYDAVVLPGGSVAVMVGDVTGHDMDAAARMGQLRSTLRAFAWDRPDLPSTWLARLDHAIKGLGLGTVATALAGRIDRVDGGYRLHWSSAGHPPPVVVRPGAGAWALGGTGANDLLLGINPQRARRDHEHRLQAGDTLLLHTDGLVERRGRPLQESLDTLTATAGRLSHLPPDKLVRALTDELVGGQPSDDTAVLAVQIRQCPGDAEVTPPGT